MSLHLVRLFTSICLFAFAQQIQAYTFSSSPPAVWPNGNVSMILKLGSAGRTLSDGNTSWDTVAQQALGAWNAYLGTIQFVSSVQSPGAGSNGDGVNQVFFNSTIYGQSFGNGTLAVAWSWSSGTRRTQADVIFNSAWSWDSYRGSLRPSSEDFRRVAIHEFGHVLGLDHPDQAGQNVSAIMNSIVSNLDGLASDDINGARFLYPSPGTSPPVITSQPQSRTVLAGASVTFSVTASSTQPMNYQWRRNGIPISGATGASYSIPNVQPSDAGNYTVVVGNAAGTVTSATAVLAVSSAPLIVVQPQGRMVTVGSSAIITVSVTGSSPLSFQWYFNGAPIPGATASAYFLASTQPGNAGAYQVRVSNSLGSAESSMAVLTIQNPAANQAGNLLVNGGFELPGTDALLLSDGSTAVPGWVSVNNIFVNGQADNRYVRAPYYGHAASEGAYFIYINNHSHASATLNGIYQDFATLPGNTYQVTFDAATEISYGIPGVLTVSAGDTVTNYTLPNVNAFPLPPALPYNFSGWHSGSFTFTANESTTRLQFFDQGVQLDGNSATGNASPLLDNVRVNLLSTSLVVDVQPTSRIALVGDNVVIQPRMQGAGPFSFQWWYKGRQLAGQTNASLSLPNIQLRSRGDYQVEARNNVSVVRSELVSVSVVIPPTILSQPRNITMREGKRVTLRVTAKGSKPFAYQWFKDGIAIAQATNKVFTFLHVAPTDGGSYSVRVSNAGAFQERIIAELTVTP